MKKKNIRNTKGRIVSTAWKLFYEQGYEDTTVDDIIYESETSKGSFYHYFSGKDALLSSLSYLFDDKYEELSDRLDGMGYIEQLLFLNRELFRMIEDTVSIELHIIVENGVNIATVCRSIMAEVKYVVSKNTGVEVRNVDVCVDSITM